MIDHTQLGKGALPDLPDDRDYEVLAAVVPVDFSHQFMLTEPPSNDQDGSGSCVAQAWSYYHWQLHNKNFSRRDIYSQIALPGGGAYIRDGGLRIVNFGQETRDFLPDPTPESEHAMLDRTGIDPNKEKINQELNSFTLAKNINSIAAGVKAYNGVVFGVTGSDEGWQDIANPRPPMAGEQTWGHALYLFGYHLHDGVPCVIAKSSWGNVGNTTVHHIKQDYFVSGNTFNPWTLIPKGNKGMQLINDQGTIFLVASDQSFKIGIGDPAAEQIFGNEPVTPGSTANIPQTGTLASGIIFHK